GVPDDATAVAGNEVARVLVLCELVTERVRRPRDRERRALHLLHAVDVVEGHVLDDDRKCCDHPLEATSGALGETERPLVRRRRGEGLLERNAYGRLPHVE